MTVSDNREKRVVIVDDSRTIQAMLESVLEAGRGFKVVGVASDAKSAAALVGRLRPDVVTIDLCMPYIDGAALLEMLAGFDDVCKVVISDHAAKSIAMMAQLRSGGAAACIAKTEVSASPIGFCNKLNAIVAAFDASRSVPRPLSGHGAKAGAGGSVHLPGRYPIPADERERLDYIRRKQLANATPERPFDLLTRYLADLTSFPVCLMTFIDKDTQWLKSSVGFPVASMPRCEAFCNYTIAQDDTFVVRNAANDRTFADHPLVRGDPHIRTYVGHPIITGNGVHVGALCVIDTKVRLTSDVLLARVRGMAEVAAEMIDMRPPMAA